VLRLTSPLLVKISDCFQRCFCRSGNIFRLFRVQPRGVSSRIIFALVLIVTLLLIALGGLVALLIVLLISRLLPRVLCLPFSNHSLTIESLVLRKDAKVVCEEAADDRGDPDGEDDLLLDSDGDVANTVIASSNFVGLVEKGEVAGVPGGK